MLNCGTLSKGAPHGQGEDQGAGLNLTLRHWAVLGGVAVGLAAGAGALAAERSTPSGYPVPRYITLKFGAVNARGGPGADHRLLYVYRAKGLPVQVVAETSEWRRICDPEGRVAWVHKRTTDGRRNVINMGPRPQPLLRRPKASSEPAAFLDVRAMAALVRCEKSWCKVKADGASGWVREGALWGTAEAPQCR
jgi:SH3-like domain-containing protein